MKSVRTLRNKPSGARLYQTKTGSVFGYDPARWQKEVTSLSDEELTSRNEQANVFRFVHAHRQYGHKYAKLNPVSVTGDTENPNELDEKGKLEWKSHYQYTSGK